MKYYLILFYLGMATKLVMGERKSFMPMTFVLITLMSYYGPNAEILGGVKHTMWQFQGTITDIQAYAIKVSLLLIGDWMSFVINTVVLWYYCKINLFEVSRKLQQEFWIVFMFIENLYLMEVSKNKSCCYSFYQFINSIQSWFSGFCPALHWKWPGLDLSV